VGFGRRRAGYWRDSGVPGTGGAAVVVVGSALRDGEKILYVSGTDSARGGSLLVNYRKRNVLRTKRFAG
jgi:hypothetical protein